jgi:hypothetical protein
MCMGTWQVPLLGREIATGEQTFETVSHENADYDIAQTRARKKQSAA